MRCPAGPVLDTPRLTLRPPEPGDWPYYLDYRLSPRSTVGGGDESMAWMLFSGFFGHWALRGYGRFIAVLKETGRPIGHFGPFRPEPWPEPELTWTIWADGLEGRGLAFEAAGAARDHAFRDLGWDTAVSYVAEGNLRSQALARRLGARPDAEARATGAGVTVWRHGDAGRRGSDEPKRGERT